ncbi:fimbrial protein [Vibrio cincinnatiensis]|uniref:fimbrial protein n=1 Tax=Vibrio cincinnatiensis TaxID=675 RepID=UPI001EDDB151|nr:fimbrial protein [Vibrio cincinnatiensis]
MKKSLAASIISGLFMASTSFAATESGVAGGTITFNGSVTDTTCNVTTNSGQDFTVNLAPISIDEIKAPGVALSGSKQFSMMVSGCTGYVASSNSAQALQITFTGANVSADEVYLENNGGTAEGVGIVITDGSNIYPLNKAIATSLKTTSSDGEFYDQDAEGTLSFFANYYNYAGEDAVTTGSVITNATYTFSYE